MAYSKVVYNKKTLIDLTADTVSASTLKRGTKAHDKKGDVITGTMDIPIAAIGVIYPAGAVCKCTNGATTLTAGDTTGSWAFLVPNTGTWTVTATQDADTDTTTVNVLAAQYYTAELSFQLYPSHFDLAAYGIKGVDYEVVRDDDTVIPVSDYRKYQNWKIRLLTSGTLKALKDGEIDVFLVGGGGGGAGGKYNSYEGTGGGGGYTKTLKNVKINKSDYPIILGAGGTGGPVAADPTSYGGDAGQTHAFNTAVDGGRGGKAGVISAGGNGGSGGAGWAGKGGVDGADGTVGPDGFGKAVGIGQHSTTREFGESTGKLYSEGGSWQTSKYQANTGNGGNGAIHNSGLPGGNGSSGIVVIRNARGT